MSKTVKILILACAVLVVFGLVIWDAPRNRLELFLEKASLKKPPETI